jgi:hypothetical protein
MMAAGPAMKRSFGVTAIATLSVLGSLLALGLGVLMLVTALLMGRLPSAPGVPAPPAAARVLTAVSSLFYILPAVWGFITSVGLFKLRNWARISTIVFSVLLVFMAGFAAFSVFFIPAPSVPDANVPADAGLIVRVVIATLGLTLAAIGVWWLVFFTRAGVKAQFVPVAPEAPAEPGARRRPVSIVAIAVIMLVGCAMLPLSMLFRPPLMLFVWLVTGWGATLCYLAFGVAQLIIAIGLLRLRPVARLAAIILCVFGALNSAVVLLAPGARERITAVMNSTYARVPGAEEWQRQFMTQIDPTPFMVMGGVLGFAMLAVALYFLITRRPAFYPSVTS